MSPENAILTIGIILISVFIVMPAFLLALAARTNHHVRQDLPASPRLKSATRWNFWTGGMTSWGGVIRLALADSRGMDDLSVVLRNWCRNYLAWTLGLGLLACLAPPSNKILGAVATILSILPMFYFLGTLHAKTVGNHEPIATATKDSLKWYAWALGLAVVTGVVLGLGLKVLAAPIGFAVVVLALKATVHFCRVGLLIGIEGLRADESDETTAGGKDALAALGYFVVVCVAALVLQLIGKHLFG